MKNKFTLYNVLEFVLFLFTIAIVFSNFLMTIADILLIAIGFAYFIKYISNSNKKNVAQFFSERKAQCIFMLIFVVCCLSLINTTNLYSGFIDIKTKIPLLIFPLVFMFLPEIKQPTITKIIYIHASVMIIASFIIVYNLFIIRIDDYRNAFPYISPIRLSLNYCTSIYLLMFQLSNKNKLSNTKRISILFVIFWFLTVLSFLKSATGFIILIVFFICFFLSKKMYIIFPKYIKVIMVSFIFLSFCFCAYSYVRYYKISAYNEQNLPEYTVNGNLYTHNTSKGVIEEGDNYMIMLCDKELRREWNKRSNIKYDSMSDGFMISSTLIRYLNSLDYTKDSVGVSKLNEQDVRNIENHCANYYYNKSFGLYSRMSKLFFSYECFKKSSNPSGSTFFQRLYYLKSGLVIVKNNPILGVGIGDLRNELNSVYATYCPKLDKSYYFSVHNQYLFFAIIAGIPGLLVFLFGIIYPGITKMKFSNYYWKYFLVIALMSMLSEDTLGTQAGVTFFSFFYFIFLFNDEHEAQ